MYNYCKIENLSGPCPVYLCVGSNEDLSAFVADVELLGLETTIVRALPGENVCFAVDPLENGKHKDSLEAAIELISSENSIPHSDHCQDPGRGYESSHRNRRTAPGIVLPG